MNDDYKNVTEFKNKYPMTVAWRLKANSKIVQKYMNPDEHVIYAFAAQKSDNSLDIFSTLDKSIILSLFSKFCVILTISFIISIIFSLSILLSTILLSILESTNSFNFWFNSSIDKALLSSNDSFFLYNSTRLFLL